MATQKELRNIADSQMNMDDASEYLKNGDTREVYNIRTTGTSGEEAGIGTNIESGAPIALSIPSGINKGLGITPFPDERKLYSFRYNSQNFHQLVEIDADTNTATVLFTNITDSDGLDILPLTPKSRIDDIILVNGAYLAWTDGGTPHYVSLPALKGGKYSPVLEEDISLVKPQNLPPITGYYMSDEGRSANLLYGKLFQFNSQFLGEDYHKSAWSTWSKRIVPEEESTPTVPLAVSKNNVIAVTVNIGNVRSKTLRIGARYDTLNWFVIKSIDREYILRLTNTAIDINTEVYEAYNPTNNTYTFLFYNDGLYETIQPLETDLPYDYVPLKAGSMELVNSNIVALADVTEGYPLPKIQAFFNAVNYQPDLSLPDGVNPDPLRVIYVYNSGAGSGLGDHKRLMRIQYTGTPKQNDKIKVVLYDIRDANSTIPYEWTVTAGEQGNLNQTIIDFGSTIPWNSFQYPAPNVIQMEFRGDPYYEVLSATVTLANAGSGVSKSLHALKSSSSYQAAVSYRDKFGRYFPLVTSNDFIFKTSSYAQSLGGSPALQWSIQEAAPADAVDFQILLSKNTSHQNTLYINGAVIAFKGSWDAKNNTPTLSVATGTVGDTYQVIQPGAGANLGSGVSNYNTGDFIVYNGLSWDVVPKEFGDMGDAGSYLFIKINPLLLFNQKNAQVNNSILNYDFTPGDRCAFAYYTTDNITKNWLNNPNIDVQVEGFNPASYILKVRSATSLDVATVAGKDILMEIYTPLKRTDLVDEDTAQDSTDFFEIGERYTITNGKHDKLNGVITDGDVYYKTRELASAVTPNNLYTFLVEDFNYSDFYQSRYSSYGRPRKQFDAPETTEKKGSIRYSDVFVLGSKNNGLTRFYGERLYGDGDGETSSSYGAIRKMYQRGNVIVVIQELEVGYIPVYSNIIEDQVENQQLAVSDKLFGKIRYNGSRIGTGRGKATFAVKDSSCYFIDTNRSEPVRAGLDGVKIISGKVSKFFKQAIQGAVGNGFGISGYIDDYNEEYVVAIETKGDVVDSVEFNAAGWKVLEDYTVLPADISLISQPANGTATYNNTNGLATYTPNNNGFIGKDSFQFGFSINGVPVVKKECGEVVAAATSINQFYFIDVDNATPNIYYLSNIILVAGVNIPVPISIGGDATAEYRINGGAWTNAPAMVSSGQDVQVRVISSIVDDATVSAVLTISGYSDSYDVKTGVTVPVCPDRTLVFQICNENAVIDDNFDIYLNDVKIGSVDLNQDAQIGSVFIASIIERDIVSADFACPVDDMVAYYFDPALVLTNNVIKMVNTQDNAHGNQGTVGIRNYLISGDTLLAPCVVADLSYSGASGSNFELPFSYTACCPND